MTEATQIPLNFPLRPASGREDFLVAPANEEAIAWIDKWPDWPTGFLVIKGPAGCGKTHLAHVWQKQTGARILTPKDLDTCSIEDIAELTLTPLVMEDMGGKINDDAFFHLFNMLTEKKQSLLMTTTKRVKKWKVKLPDLKSRLGTVPVAKVQQPDDQLFAALIVKHISDRQLAVEPDVVQYLVMRLERSFAEVRRFIALVDAKALAGGRKITKPFIRELLKEKEQGK
ncbi:MAG: DnaA/Hda family protein [Proteobacteria bacterium]|nr:DnaA/Hda family protein [Pseudomonadota bacterium]